MFNPSEEKKIDPDNIIEKAISNFGVKKYKNNKKKFSEKDFDIILPLACIISVLSKECTKFHNLEVDMRYHIKLTGDENLIKYSKRFDRIVVSLYKLVEDILLDYNDRVK